MTMMDYLTCTPDGFAAIMAAWAEEDELRTQEAWEQTRLLAYYAIRPHIGNNSRWNNPRSVIPLPWDKVKAPNGASEAPKSTADRFRELTERLK